MRKSGCMIKTKGPLVSSLQIQKVWESGAPCSREQKEKIVIPTQEEGEIRTSTVFLFLSGPQWIGWYPHWEGRSLLIQMLISSWKTFPGASRTLTRCLGILIPGRVTHEMRRRNKLSSEVLEVTLRVSAYRQKKFDFLLILWKWLNKYDGDFA